MILAIGVSLFLRFSWLTLAEQIGRFLEVSWRRIRERRESEEDRRIGELKRDVIMLEVVASEKFDAVNHRNNQHQYHSKPHRDMEMQCPDRLIQDR